MGLKTLRKERIFIKMFGNKTSNALSVDIVPLKVVSGQKIVTIEAICTPVICADLLNQNIQHISTRYPHLTGLKLAKTSKNLNKQIQILIGSDYCYSFIFGEVLKEEVNEPVAISSLFGWILSGCFDNPTSVNLNSVHVLRIHTKTMSENIFNDKLDSCSKHVFSRHQESKKVANNKAYVDFKDNLSFENGRYSTKLLFKEFYHVLSDNYRLTVKKFNYLKRRLSKDKAHLDEYNKIFNDYLNNNIIEKVDIKKGNPGAGKVHYLPHRPVIKSDRETTKICIAFDASAHVIGELYLNYILDSEPCLIQLIFDILLRFRTGKIGLVTDMKQAFLQINIAEKHRDFLRFIWHQDQP